ncbi:P-loop containing nucleoside triphosphate hydrolase protein [Rozella allomycis CSF55]|uniref:RNA helicase n=1 Tax=Rozella allomycis (strain CSF55) TaxID=988480 RepID=A0A075AQY8_ROZAC|nr:Helicase-associated domain-containing protein [Rozella allomycis CSF55]RKP22176.1 P-loop containing nucleoside triphosphate hydrolase protein [Rozella allomycis CSF55]|eukprot:EPZ30997.1 Helicase-associated domain-containing protein [Rozella allomycis CSF55]
MGKKRVRYNEKGRQSKKGESKGEDSNVLIIDPSQPVEIEEPKMPEKMNPKKKKRLEKYIERKLKKEEKVLLMEKLSKSAFKSELLVSTKNLGHKVETKKEKLRRVLQEQRLGLPLTYEDTDLVKEKIVEDIDESSEEEEELSTNLELEEIMEKREMIEEKEKEEKIKSLELEKAKEEEERPKLIENTEINNRKAFYVPVNRSDDIRVARMKLPVVVEEQQIMESIYENDVVIICGETGSGKTTQVPQFLYEAGFGHPDSENPGIVGVTQPRRVAAVSMAQRVATELNLSSEYVSHQIRFDSSVSKKTVIKFMTDGVLLKEIAKDFMLSSYSVLIIDEAHERSLNSDIAIGLVSRIVKLRREKEINGIVRPLKIIIMSATLRVDDFANNPNLFTPSPPVIHIKSRQFPVTIHFNKKTPDDYLDEAFKKICQIHSKLPAGGILVFLTGQNEVHALCKKLKSRYPSNSNQLESKISKEKTLIAKREEIDAGSFELDEDPDEVIEQVDSPVDESKIEDDFYLENDTKEPLHVLPLYALLPTDEQLKVFKEPPPGHRLCVVATNVAETSLTIPGISYVVDSGKVKERVHDAKSKMQSFKVDWTSKASADQRSGRAGRVGPGHCYRLYHSAVFDNNFEKFSKPEIERMPIEGVVLQMKSMHIDNVVNFPFPSPPNSQILFEAEKLLMSLEALDTNNKSITYIGRMMSAFPISPRFAKMIILGMNNNVLQWIIPLVAALSVGDPFVRDLENGIVNEKDSQDSEEKREKRKKYFQTHQTFAGKHPDSDSLKLLSAFCASEYSSNIEDFCNTHFLRPKAIKEMKQLKAQLISIARVINPKFCEKMKFDKVQPPNDSQRSIIKQIIASGFIDQIAKLKPKMSHEKAFKYQTLLSKEDALIHPSSCLFNESPPEFVVYEELVQTSHVYIKGLTAISESIIPIVARSQCTFSKPLDTPEPFYNSEKDKMICYVKPSFGTVLWELTPTPIEFPECVEKYRYFLKNLLEGNIIKGFSKFTGILNSKPISLLRPWAQKKLVDLIVPVKNNKISTKKDLLEKWKSNPSFLLHGYLQWIPIEHQPVVKQEWTKLIKE